MRYSQNIGILFMSYMNQSQTNRHTSRLYLHTLFDTNSFTLLFTADLTLVSTLKIGDDYADTYSVPSNSSRMTFTVLRNTFYPVSFLIEQEYDGRKLLHLLSAPLWTNHTVRQKGKWVKT